MEHVERQLVGLHPASSTASRVGPSPTPPVERSTLKGMRALATLSLILVSTSCGLLGGGRAVDVPPAAVERTASGLEWSDTRISGGREAVLGSSVTLHYEGRLEDGSVYDSSHLRAQPVTFRLGERSVIKGWDEGLLGMREGGVRMLKTPPHLAHGERGVPPVVPGNATLTFVIELLRVE